jgi:hypothetical protein
MAQMTEYLLCNFEALSTNPSSTKKKYLGKNIPIFMSENNIADMATE